MNHCEIIGSGYFSLKPTFNDREALAEAVTHLWALEILIKRTTTNKTVISLAEDTRALLERIATENGLDLGDLKADVLN